MNKPVEAWQRPEFLLQSSHKKEKIYKPVLKMSAPKMRESLPKVLMLGWEFPPIINGGLGVACHDLSFALSDFADISMIIPKSSPGFIMSKVNLIGMNTVNPEMLAQLTSPVDMPFSTHAIPADLDPYHSSQSDSINKKSEQRAGAVQAQKNNFDITDLYGGDVIKKVFDFARHASAYAAQLDFDIIHAHD